MLESSYELSQLRARDLLPLLVLPPCLSTSSEDEGSGNDGEAEERQLALEIEQASAAAIVAAAENPLNRSLVLVDNVANFHAASDSEQLAFKKRVESMTKRVQNFGTSVAYANAAAALHERVKKSGDPGSPGAFFAPRWTVHSHWRTPEPPPSTNLLHGDKSPRSPATRRGTTRRSLRQTMRSVYMAHSYSRPMTAPQPMDIPVLRAGSAVVRLKFPRSLTHSLAACALAPSQFSCCCIDQHRLLASA